MTVNMMAMMVYLVWISTLIGGMRLALHILDLDRPRVVRVYENENRPQSRSD